MRPLRTRRARYSSRPFFVSTFIITLIATYALFVRPLFGVTPDAGVAGISSHDGHAFGKREVGEECRMVHQAPDKCAFVLQNCDDDEAGLIDYLTFYYCTLGNAQPVAFILLVLWLGLLFTTIGIAASDFFSVNLSTIASILGLSESLAGVTFLAFGNGSPDVFSTFAAMDSNSGSMAVGELIGAAGFITAVVAGSMALVREFKVSRKTYVRDIGFFIASVSFAMVFLADGELHLWECCTMIGFYVFYVCVVVGWHWYTTQRRNRRKKDAASRSHLIPASGRDATDELAPYRDDEDEDDDDAAPVGRRSDSSAEDISALERGPRIEVESPRDGSVDDDERGMHLTAEMTSSMRINRPRGRRTTTTITPIRPSLVGVLEFRSILSSLQKSGNVHLGPITSGHSRSYSNVQPGTLASEASTSSLGDLLDASPYGPQSDGRNRALSSGDRPLNLQQSQTLSAPTIIARAPSDEQIDLIMTGDGAQSIGSRTPLSTVSPKTVPQDEDGRLLPEAIIQQKQPSQQPPGSHSPTLDIPSPHRLSPSASPPLVPFPGYSESPLPMSPSGTPPIRHHPHAPSFMLPTPSLERDISFPGVEYPEGDRPVRWWPYKVLPPPQVLLSTLFPTLQSWSEKSIWDKFISIISVPTIFLLVTTLPVVEAESPHDDASDDGMDDGPALGQPGAMAPPVSIERDASIEPETEWQRYRRSTASLGSRSPNSMRSPAILAFDGQSREHVMQPPSPALLPQVVKPVPAQIVEANVPSGPEATGWNRWLVCLQIFTGPLFTVFILWANMEETMEKPGKVLLKLVLYSLVVSLVLLATVLATTTPEKRPKYHFLLCFLGFIISIAWISTVAGEVVGVLKAFGVIVGISEAILGLTIFAVGNSVGDLVADITVARLGYPVMALSACFGGPMLNILLGVGLGGAWMTIKAANHKHDKHPDHPVKYKPYHIHVSGTLLISAVTVLLTLVFLLIAVPSNKWIMSRKIGLSLIGIWIVSTIVNVIVEVTGVGDTMMLT